MGNIQPKLNKTWKEEQLFNPFGYYFQKLENGVKVSTSGFKVILAPSPHLEINVFFLIICYKYISSFYAWLDMFLNSVLVL